MIVVPYLLTATVQYVSLYSPSAEGVILYSSTALETIALTHARTHARHAPPKISPFTHQTLAAVPVSVQ